MTPRSDRVRWPDRLWMLRRLRAMPAAEIWHRTRVALRDRWRPPAYFAWTPAQAYRHLFTGSAEDALRSSRLHRLLAPPAHRVEFEPEIAAATALLSGRWNLFGHDVSLDDPPRWSRNALTGAAWPDVPSRRLDYRRADVAGGVRYVWELGRLTVLPTLALASRVTGDPAFAERAVRWLDDWNDGNPLGRGIHHTSALEMAIRVATVCATLALLGDRAATVHLEPCLGLLAQQALYCRDHPSVGGSANNHLIGEHAAGVLMGAMFPSLRPADALLDGGLAGLQREILRQFHPDGVNAEQAFGYLPLVWELALYALRAAEVAGRSVDPAVKGRLAASLEFARAIRLPDGGYPQVGDGDDSRVLLAGERGSRVDLVGNALAAWLEQDALSEVETGLAVLLGGRIASARRAADGHHTYPDGGYTVWRLGGLLVTFDHGPLGLGPLAAHGHADALSLTVFRGRDAVVIDPGMPAYQEDLRARDQFRGTPYHSTVHFRGGSQSQPLGPFLWGKRARVRAHAGGFACRWSTGETHTRRVAVAADRLDVIDGVDRDGAVVAFVLAPGAGVEIRGSRAVVTVGETQAVFEGRGITGWQAAPGECAPRFGQMTPTLRLLGPLGASACHTTITLGVA